MKNILSLLISGVFILPLFIFSQSAEDKTVQAGLTFNAGANILSPSSTKIGTDGAGSLLSIGLNLHSAFKSSQNLAVATGIEFDFGKNKYNLSDDAFADFYDGEYLTSDEANQMDGDLTSSYSTYNISSRIVSTTKLTVPLMLLFRTNFIGDFRYFGKFGIRNSFLLTHSIEDLGSLIGGSNDNNLLMRSPGEMFLYNGSIGLSAGAEWNFVGSTCLVLEAGYFYGITPFFLDRLDSNKTMYTLSGNLIAPAEKNYFSAAARQNQLIFKLSILF